MHYNYNTELPFSGKKIKFREITTNEQLLLAKANLSFPNKRENYYDYNDFIFKIIKGCIENYEEFENINIIDYVLFLTKLRIVSIGPTLEFVTKSEDEEVKTSKTTLNLNLFLKNLYYAANETIKDNFISEGNIKIKINWPSTKSINVFQDLIKKSDSNGENITNSFQEFVEYIEINEEKIVFSGFDYNQKIQLIEKLSVSLMRKLQETILSNLKQLSECDLWGIESFKNHVFNFYNLSYIDFIRLFFSYDVRSLYQEIYYMANEGLPPDYILNISPIERKIYSSIITEARKRKESQDSDGVNNMISRNMSKSSKTVQDLALEFGQTAP